MKVLERVHNELLKPIILIVTIAGVIELFALVLTIYINNVQHHNYETVIENEYTIIRDVNEIMIGTYQMKNLVVKYANDNDGKEDYLLEIGNKQEVIESYVAELSQGADGQGKQYYKDKIEDINGQYEKFAAGLDNLVIEILNGETVTVDQIDMQLGDSMNQINQYCNVIQMYADISETEKSNSISTLNTISRTIDAFVVAITIGSIVVCMYIAGKNGAAMAEKQEKAERRAVDSAKKAYTDGLTGLWNRAYTEKAVGRWIREGTTGCLFMMDMDNFKSVNDTYGHIAGDKVLKTFADAMKKSAREKDICCRIGGDEFMMFARHLDPEKAHIVANRIIKIAREQLSNIEGGKFVSVSIGGAFVESNTETFQELYDRADAALYYRKEHGKAGFHFYTVGDKREAGVERQERNARIGKG